MDWYYHKTIDYEHGERCIYAIIYDLYSHCVRCFQLYVKALERCVAKCYLHDYDVMISEMAYQITSVSIVCSIVCSVADQRKHQSFASLVFVREIHQSPVDSPHKGPVARKMFSFDDIIMIKDSGIRYATGELYVLNCEAYIHVYWSSCVTNAAIITNFWYIDTVCYCKLADKLFQSQLFQPEIPLWHRQKLVMVWSH